MLSEKCFVVFYVFSFPAGVYVGTLNLIVSIPDPCILTLYFWANFYVLLITTKGVTHVHVFSLFSANGHFTAMSL